jgi:hypothetical protein
MLGKILSLFAAAGLAAALPAFAASPEPGRAAVLEAVTACRKVGDDAQRLACFDKAVGRLESAEAAGEVAVVDREQMQQAKRSAFGFNIQMPNVFSRGAAKDEAVDSLSARIKSAGRTREGKLTVTLEDGAVWRQIGQEELNRQPQPGMAVEIKKASLGSYFMKVDGQPAIRVHRDD